MVLDELNVLCAHLVKQMAWATYRFSLISRPKLPAAENVAGEKGKKKVTNYAICLAQSTCAKQMA